MWRSVKGEEVVSGACAELFVGTLWEMADLLRDNDPIVWSSVKLFDGLTAGEQAALLEEVGTAALRSDLPSPPLYAATEATLVAIFMASCVGIEDEEEPSGWFDLKSLIIRAARERGVWFDETVEGSGPEEWVALVDAIAHSYLWDMDYAQGEALADLAPEASTKIRNNMGILDEYYTWSPEDYGPDRIKSSMKALVEFCKGLPG